MTEELTLREKVLSFLDGTPVPNGGELGQVVPKETLERIIDRVAGQLENTGSPAHMRVAAELRGE